MEYFKFREVVLDNLKDCYSYDSETGLFTRIKPSQGAHVGRVCKTKNNNGYILVVLMSQPYLAHRLAWLYVYEEMPKGFIDHINGIKTDNRIDNLREVTNAENIQNQTKPRKDNTTGYLGVYNADGNKFFARIKANSTIHHLGTFDTAEQASNAYLEAKRRLHKTCTI